MRADGLTMATALSVHDQDQLRVARQKMGGEPPLWMQIFPYPKYVGEWEGERTTWVTDDKSQLSIVEHFEAKGNPLVIDFEHQSDETESGVIALAAGRLTQLVAGGKKGLLAKCEWNRFGEWVLREGLYYLDSPSFWFGKDDLRIYVLRHLALTNNPASEKRMYVTDHSKVDYGIEKVAASTRRSAPGALVLVKSSATSTNRPISEASLRSKAGGNMKLSDFLSSLRYTLGRPVTATGKEIRTDLEKILKLVPDTDDMIFLEEESESGTKPDEAMSIAQLLGETALTAALEAAAQKTSAPTPPSIKAICIALGVAETTSVDDAAKAIVNLKATTVPVSEVQALQANTSRLEDSLSKARQAKTLTPFREREARRLASQSVDLAVSYVEALAPLDLASQTETAKEPAAKGTPNVAAGGDDDEVVSESQTMHDRVMSLVTQSQKDGKPMTYNQAYACVKGEDAAKAK